MTVADRLSGRVGESTAKAQVSTGDAAGKGADGVGARTSSTPAVSRLGRRGVDALRQEMTERELAVVVSVAEFRFLTARQIERLHFTADDDANRTMARTARRVLERLARQRILSRLQRRIGGMRAGSASFVYSLGPIGQRLLRLPGPRRRHREPSSALLSHCLAVADVFVSVAVAAKAGEIEIVNHQAEPHCWRTVPALAGTEWLRPDLYLVLARADTEWHWFVEVDLGTEHAPVIRRKSRQYQTYYQTGTEQARHGVFPRVAWLTATADRARQIEHVIAGDRDLRPELFVVGTISEAAMVLAPEDQP